MRVSLHVASDLRLRFSLFSFFFSGGALRMANVCGGQDANERGGAGDECEGKQRACSASEFEVHWAAVGRVMMGF